MWTVDESWKRDVKTEMKRRGISQRDLALQIGVTPSAITVLFRPETKQTRLKPAIHKALAMVAPSSTPAVSRDEVFSRLLKVWPQMSEEERELLVATGEALATKR